MAISVSGVVKDPNTVPDAGEVVRIVRREVTVDTTGLYLVVLEIEPVEPVEFEPTTC